MSLGPAEGARPRRILVLANETCAGSGVLEEVRYRAGGDAEVLVVAPALARSRLEHWLSSDNEGAQAAAEARLAASLAAMEAAGIAVRGHLGDGDPLQALDDALRLYDPDEVVISTHPPSRSNWLERQVVRRARERYPLPIHHVVVDLEHEASARADGPPPEAPAQARAAADAAESRRLRLYHASPYDEALAIRARGFRDRSAWADRVGVWMSDRPPTAGGAEAEAVLFAVELPEAAARRFAAEDGDDGERRFLMPAELLNRHGPPVAVDDWSE